MTDDQQDNIVRGCLWAYSVVIVGLVLMALLSGCASAPPLETGPQTVRVEVPVARPCIAAADVPVPPRVVLVDPDTASREQLAAALGANVYALLAYARRADAALKACTEPTKGAPP